MPQDYKVTSVKPTGFTDQNGNDGYNVWFEGVPESALMLAKKPPVEGGVEHGEIKDLPAKKDPTKTYKRFTRVQREDVASTVRSDYGTYPVVSDPRQESIERQCALKEAVEMYKNDDVSSTMALELAGEFLAWIKDGTMPGDDTSGYEAAKATAERLKNPGASEDIVKSIEEVFDIETDSDDPGPSDGDFQG